MCYELRPERVSFRDCRKWKGGPVAVSYFCILLLYEFTYISYKIYNFSRVFDMSDYEVAVSIPALLSSIF